MDPRWEEPKHLPTGISPVHPAPGLRRDKPSSQLRLHLSSRPHSPCAHVPALSHCCLTSTVSAVDTVTWHATCPPAWPRPAVLCFGSGGLSHGPAPTPCAVQSHQLEAEKGGGPASAWAVHASCGPESAQAPAAAGGRATGPWVYDAASRLGCAFPGTESRTGPQTSPRCHRGRRRPPPREPREPRSLRDSRREALAAALRSATLSSGSVGQVRRYRASLRNTCHRVSHVSGKPRRQRELHGPG